MKMNIQEFRVTTVILLLLKEAEEYDLKSSKKNNFDWL